jgi:decaprenylphospho-beta-D-ribofuranose 2-oxidase
MRSAAISLSGWGRTVQSACDAVRPERMAEALSAFASPAPPKGVVVRGAGRSYGDCALNSGGQAMLTGRLDRILAFDPDTMVVQVEPGVDFRRLLHVFLPRGFLAPVTPGTGFATIGGAVANDVHGKNHETAGSFAQHVTEIDLVTPDGVMHTVLPGTDVFRATAGGLGLTGLMTRIAFRMKRVPSTAVRVREQRAENLDGFLAAMRDAAGASYSVGWIDGTARGGKLGRGILETAEPAAESHVVASGKTRRVPIDFPGFALNPLSVALFNQVYFHRVPRAGRSRIAGYAKFLYPLDAIHDWNRIYGRAGFQQFQCVVPFEDGEAALRDLLEVIAESRQASFLAVLKRMGPGRAGFLSFPSPGYTLALDFPQRSGIKTLYARLVSITLRYGGRIYLGKDALLDAASFRIMYPEFPEFAAVLADIDQGQMLQSNMSRRLALHQAA